MRPEIAAEVRDWFAAADEDLRAADVDLAASPPLIRDALFHSQQAVEKAIKGVLTAHSRTFRKTHDLDELATACVEVHESLQADLDPARELSVYAWHFRYPGPVEVPSIEEANEVRNVASAAVYALKRILADLDR